MSLGTSLMSPRTFTAFATWLFLLTACSDESNNECPGGATATCGSGGSGTNIGKGGAGGFATAAGGTGTASSTGGTGTGSSTGGTGSAAGGARIVSINGLAARIKPARAGETAGETAGRLKNGAPPARRPSVNDRYFSALRPSGNYPRSHNPTLARRPALTRTDDLERNLGNDTTIESVTHAVALQAASLRRAPASRPTCHAHGRGNAASGTSRPAPPQALRKARRHGCLLRAVARPSNKRAPPRRWNAAACGIDRRSRRSTKGSTDARRYL